MKNTMTESAFKHGIKEIRPDNFTWAGLGALFEMLVSYEEDCGTEIEYDPIAFCCEYSEFGTLEDFQDDYGKDEYPDMGSIQNATVVHEFNGGFIIQDF
jgi:hypothetical protein